MTALTDAEMRAIAARIPAAIKATEYKYFGDYEFSPDQHAAVDTLVEAAAAFPALLDRLAKAEARVVEMREALQDTVNRFEYASSMFHNVTQWGGEDAPGGGDLDEWVWTPSRAALATPDVGEAT